MMGTMAHISMPALRGPATDGTLETPSSDSAGALSIPHRSWRSLRSSSLGQLQEGSYQWGSVT